MTQFWWVRHGPTHLKAAIGWSDPPADLSDKNALSRLDQYLPDDALLVSSDLQRAVKTADEISAGRHRIEALKELREMNYGRWDGMAFDEIAQTDPDLSREFWENPGDVSPPDGESWNMLSTRIHNTIQTLSGQHDEIIVVAHFGVILAALQTAGNFSPSNVFSFKIDNLSVTRLEYLSDASTWRIHGVNHCP